MPYKLTRDPFTRETHHSDLRGKFNSVALNPHTGITSPEMVIVCGDGGRVIILINDDHWPPTELHPTDDKEVRYVYEAAKSSDGGKGDAEDDPCVTYNFNGNLEEVCW